MNSLSNSYSILQIELLIIVTAFKTQASRSLGFVLLIIVLDDKAELT